MQPLWLWRLELNGSRQEKVRVYFLEPLQLQSIDLQSAGCVLGAQTLLPFPVFLDEATSAAFSLMAPLCSMGSLHAATMHDWERNILHG